MPDTALTLNATTTVRIGDALHELADVDGRDHVAWVALLAGSPAGICRYVRTTSDSAEVAVEVVDAAQGRGIGTALIDAVTTAAQANGVAWLEAVVRPGNRASAALLYKVGISLVLEDGLLVGRGRLRLLGPRPRVNRRAVRLPRRDNLKVGSKVGRA